MHYFAVILSLLALKAEAIDFVLFEDNDCNTPDPPSHVCIDANYGVCCGTFTNGNTGLHGAAAVSMGATPIQNTPTLRAYSEGGNPVAICGQVRASWTLANDPNNPGTFPCASGPSGLNFNGYKVESIVTGRHNEKRDQGLGHVMEPNGYGIVVNNTIYAIMRDSRIGRLYKELEGKMTTKEKRLFIINYAENEKRNDTKIFKI